MAADEELDLDPIEPVEEPKPKTKDKGDRAKDAKPDRGQKDPPDPARPPRGKGKGEPVERVPRKSVAGDRKVPYPPTPPDVPDGLTDYADSYTRQQNLLLAGLFVFLVFYIGAVLFFALIGAWCIWSLHHYPPLKIIGIVFSSIFFLYLVKGFFKRHPMNKEMHIEITEEEHPVLFEFIYQLCDELGAPLPNKVYVAPDVNAAVMPRTSLINLFVEPKKDLLIGLGLVNSVNLSEFKAVLAHEFGHFSQSAMASSYTYVANRIIADLVEGEDWFDRVVNWLKKQDNVFAVVGHAIGAPLWVGRKVLEWCYKGITLQRLAVSREREFHADLVAVSAAGSNAVVHCLLRTEFGHQCFMQALNDMATAIDHKLYSNDMYLHQDRAAVIVRRKKKEPELGLPPALKSPAEGKAVEVFDAEQEEMEDEIPPMWRTHPSNSDREKNAKEEFVAAAADHRSPWILFDEPADLRERMTYKFYRMVFRIPKNADLADALKVQKFIDNEHADTTYDPKYKGAYDDRPLEPGELAELNGLVREKPWDDERMEKVLDKLYDGCEAHAEAHSELYKEEQSLRSGIVGRPSPKMKRKLEEIKEKQDENWEWFKSFDRRVYLLHVQMAVQVDKELREELVERYRFQLEVQRLYQESRAAFNKADAYLGAYAAAARGEIQVGPDFAGEVIQVLRESWKALKNIIKDARDITLPTMKNFEENENLAEFILEGKMVPEPPLSYVKGVWIDKLMTQLQGVRQKCFRLHFKSVGGILKLQEDIATKWKALREPVAAEVLEEPVAAEVVAAEVIPAEVVPADPPAGSGNLDVIKTVINEMGGADAVLARATARAKAPAAPAEPPPAEVVPAEVVAAEVVPAEVVAEELPAEVVPAEVIPAEVIPAAPPPPPAVPAPPKAMAAFVAPAPVAPWPEARSAVPLVPPPPPVAEAPAPPPPPAAKPAEPVKPVLKSADPFDFGPSAAPKPAAPAAGAPAPAPPAASPAAAGANEVFSLDADEAKSAPAPAAPAKPAGSAPKTPPAAPVAAEETFSLDADEAPAKPAASGPVGFSLDADDHKPAPAPAAKPASGVFPGAAATPTGSTAVPSPTSRAPAAAPGSAVKPPLSGVADASAARSKPGSGSGSSTVLAVKPAKPRRPPIRITMVKPGEKSPLAK
jgi:Zn-dependent protease with chaperone function